MTLAFYLRNVLMINIEMKTKLKETSMQTPQLELVIGNYLFCHYKYPTSFVEISSRDFTQNTLNEPL